MAGVGPDLLNDTANNLELLVIGDPSRQAKCVLAIRSNDDFY